MKHTAKKGFTLIELLVVIVILSVLAVTVFIALDPAKRIKDAKDDRRLVDMDSILAAVHSYIVDNKGSLPAGLTTGMVEKHWEPLLPDAHWQPAGAAWRGMQIVLI